MELREYLNDRVLLFDGGMGTLCAELVPELAGTPCELLNLSHREKVEEIHRAYVKAGSRAIKTNTFGVNRLNMEEAVCERVLCAGWEIATSAAGDAFVFADVGPITVTDKEDIREEYRFVAETFLRCGAKHFLFETMSSPEGLLETARYIKEREKNAYILISYATQPDGFTRAGQPVSALLTMTAQEPCVDAVGLNCGCGARHMARLAQELPDLGKPLSLMPNAGYPTVLGNRTFYEGDPGYFGRQLSAVAVRGARILGGCCGTTPRHIASVAEALQYPSHSPVALRYERPRQEEKYDAFWEALCDREKRPFAVELDPPENADIGKFMQGARELVEKGADVITIADCPIARARMDSSLLACKLHRELGVGVLPHMTCRDRNLNAIKSLLLGLCAEGVHNVLTVTGDPIPSALRDEVKSVYNFNSRMLAGYITALGQEVLSTPFHIFGALNVNAHNFEIQLKIAKEKEKNGICGFLTQPVLTGQAVENLKLARQELKGKILGGIFPLVSHRNALYMSSEVAGVKVDERIIALYEGLDREAGEAMALKISAEVAKAICPYVDGYYLMTPFSRTELMGKLMEEIGR